MLMVLGEVGWGAVMLGIEGEKGSTGWEGS